MNSGSTTNPTDPDIYEALTSLEGRLREQLDKSLGEVKDLVRDQQKQMTEVMKTMATRTDIAEQATRLTQLASQLQDHISTPGHSMGMHQLQEVKSTVEALGKRLDTDEAQRRQRPIQRWQIISGAIFVGATIIGSALNIIGFFLHH